MLAKGFTFADESQEKEFIGLFKEAFEDHCGLVIAGKFSTFQMVLGQTVREDKLNFKDGTIVRGKGALYDKCIKALESLDSDMANKVEQHMSTK